MTSSKSVKQVQPTSLNPNFFLPPNVVDMRYIDVDIEDTSLVRGDDGEITGYLYDDETQVDADLDYEPVTDAGASTLISPPETITFIEEQVRVTTDGKFVVDVIIEVDDIPGVTYDVSLTKP